MEVVTLVVPGFNDSPEELRDMARFLVSVSPRHPVARDGVPPRLQDRRTATRPRVRTLLRAAEIGREEGLRFVYAGNLPGAVRRWENTYCPGCDTLLVERTGFRVTQNVLGPDGRCPACRRSIPGIWA